MSVKLQILTVAMPSPDSVLLPKVFPSDLLSLGQIVRSPLTPNVNTYTKGCKVVQVSDRAQPTSEEPFNAIVSLDKRGRFDIGLINFLSTKLYARSANLISIEADKLEYHALKDATDVLRRVTADEDARKWINDMVLHKTPCYFVVAIKVLKNAVFKRAVLKEAGAGASATVPLEHTGQMPIHFEGLLSADQFGKSDGKVSGVFGVEVQRLDTEIGPEGNVHLQGDVSWHWTYQRVKGTQQEKEEVLHIKLMDVGVPELVSLQERDDADDDDDEEDEE